MGVPFNSGPGRSDDDPIQSDPIDAGNGEGVPRTGPDAAGYLDASTPGGLLAVDLGLRCGVAWFDATGRLLQARSHHLSNRTHLKRALRSIMRERPLQVLVTEGARDLARVWEKEAAGLGLEIRRVTPAEWRSRLLPGKHRHNTARAKEAAGRLARRVMRLDGLPRPTSLRHDAAEAVAIGLYAVLELGWRNAPWGGDA